MYFYFFIFLLRSIMLLITAYLTLGVVGFVGVDHSYR